MWACMSTSVTKVPVTGVFETNCYFHIDDMTSHGFLVDPGAEAGRLLSLIAEKSWHIEAILLTHGHFDHTGAVKTISDELGIPYFIHASGDNLLKDAWLNLSAQCECPQTLDGARHLQDGDVLRLAASQDVSLRVLHVPGHTPDSIALHDQATGIAYVGDTIFRGSLGTDRYPTGNRRDLLQSARRILSLPANTALLPGHGPNTRVVDERKRLGC